jgi:hypothetical protein
MSIMASHVSEWRTIDVMVNAIIRAAKILKIGPNFWLFSDSCQVSIEVLIAIPRIAPAIHPATIFATAISTGQEAYTKKNVPMYWTASDPTQRRQSRKIKIKIEVKLTKTTAPKSTGSEIIANSYLCRKTKINANRTNAHRMPPSPSKTVENKLKILATTWNSFHKMR